MYFHSFLRFFRRTWSRGTVTGKRPRDPRTVATVPGVERLEAREMLSGTPPTIVSVTPVSGTTTTTASPTITVTYSEAMGASAFQTNDYVLLNSSGTPVTITGVQETTSTEATILYSGPLLVDTYSLYVKGNLVESTGGVPLTTSQELIAANVGQSNVSTAASVGNGTLSALSNYTIPGSSTNNSAPYAVAIGNLTGSGVDDLVVVDSGTSQVSIYAGQSAAQGGGFDTTSPITLDLPSGSAGAVDSLVVTNLNTTNGGLPDIAVVSASSDTVSVFLNTTVGGSLSFAGAANYTTTGTPVALAVGNLNPNSTNPDLIVADSTAPGNLTDDPSASTTDDDYRVDVFQGIGQGSFNPTPLSFSVGNSAPLDLETPTSVAVINVGGNKPDIAVGGANGVVLLTNTSSTNNNGTGINFDMPNGLGNPEITTATMISSLTSVVSLTSGDLGTASNTGTPDLVATTAGASGSATATVNVLTDLGGMNGWATATFTVAAGTANANGSVALGDLNNDGRNDLVVTNGAAAGEVSVLANAGAITAMSNSGTTPGSSITITSPDNGLTSGETVTISNTVGDTAANGTFTVSNVSTNQFTITPTSGTYGTYPGGAIVSATGSGSSNVVITVTSTSGLTNNETLTIAGVAGFPALDGQFTISNITASTFQLQNTNTTAFVGSGLGGTFFGDASFVLSNTVSNASSPTSGTAAGLVTITTPTTNGLATGDVITLSGVPLGTFGTSINGTYTITVVNGTSFSLNGTDTTGTANGGTWKLLNDFVLASTTSVDNTPYGVAIFDSNGDGNLDVVTANNTGNDASLLLGNGNGSFQAATSTAISPTYANSVIEGDLNGDGIPDLVVVNYYKGTGTSNETRVSVFAGLSTGGFSTTPFVFAPSTSIETVVSVALGNVTGYDNTTSSLPDIILLDQADSTVGFLFNQIATPGTALSATSFSTTPPGFITSVTGNGTTVTVTVPATTVLTNGESITLAGINGFAAADGTYTIGGVSTSNGSTTFTYSDAGATGTGTGGLYTGFTSAPSPVSVGNTPYQIVAAAFGPGNAIDLAVAHDGTSGFGHGNTNQGVTILLNTTGANGVPAFSSEEYDSGDKMQAIAVGYFYGGTYPDLVTLEPSTNKVYLLYNEGNTKGAADAGLFTSGPTDTLQDLADPDSVAVSDFNGDGIPDIVIASGSTNTTEGGIDVLINQGGSSGFGKEIHTSVDAGVALNDVIVSDINGAGLPDVLVSTQIPQIISASNSSPITITANTTAGLSNGEKVTIEGVQGDTAANGTWVIENLSGNTFKLTGSTGNGADIGYTGTYFATSDTTFATNDNVFVLIGTGDGEFDSPVPYFIANATSSNYPATSNLAITPSPLTLLTTFTTTGNTVSNNLITNGNFEAYALDGSQGNLLGWNTYSLVDPSAGNYGDWLPQTGTTSPLSGTTVPAPTGSYQAMLDEENLTPYQKNNPNTGADYEGTNVLYQDFTVPADATSLSLSLSLYLNSAAAFASPSPYSLDYSTADANQQVRVDLLSVASGSITGASNGSPIVITTASTAGLTTGMNVTVSGVEGDTAANGLWTVTVLSSTQFSLNGSNGAVTSLNSAYVSGTGTWTLPILGDTTADGLLANLYETATTTSQVTTVNLNTAIAATGSITNASNAGPIVITTSSSIAGLLQTGDTVTISGVLGNTAANGTFTITVLDNNDFSLNGTTGNGNYTSGGTWSLPLLQLLAGKTIRLRITGVDNQGLLIVGVDNVAVTATYADTTPPTLTGLELRNPGVLGGTNGTTPYTDDPTLIGTVDAFGGVNNINPKDGIEFSLNNDGFSGTDVVKDLTFDPNGNFQFTLPNVSAGLNTIGVQVVDKAGNVYDTTFTFYMLTSGDVATWEALGPQAISTVGQTGVNYTSVSGDVTVTIPDLSDPTGNSYFVGSDNGGVWKTTNGGASWTPLTDYVYNSSGTPLQVPIGGLAQSISNPQILYAGTGVGNDNLDSSAGIGVLKSTNDGKTWTLIGNSATVLGGARVTAVVVNANDPDIVYVAVASGGQNGPGIYESTDGGLTWKDVLVGSEMFLSGGGTVGAGSIASVTDLIVDPFNSSRLIAGLGNIGLATASSTGGVWLTANGGASWSEVVGGANGAGNTPIPNSTLPSGTGVGRVTIAIGSGQVTSESTYYVLIGTPPTSTTAPNLNYGSDYAGTSGSGLYKTSNNGLDFTDVMLEQDIGTGIQPDEAGTHQFVPIDLFGGNASNSGALLVDPNDPNVVYVGGSNLDPDSQTNTAGASKDVTHALIRVDTGNMLDANTSDGNGAIINNGDDVSKYNQGIITNAGYYNPDATTPDTDPYTGEGVYWYDLIEASSGSNGKQNNLPGTINSLAFNADGQLLVGTSGGLFLGTALGFGYDFTSGGTGILRGGNGGGGGGSKGFSAPGMTFANLNANLQISDMTSTAIDSQNPGTYYTTEYFTGSASTSGNLSWSTLGLTGPTLASGDNLGIETAADIVAVNPTPESPTGTPITLFRTWQYANSSALVPEESANDGTTFGPISGGGINPNGTAGNFTAFAVNPTPILESGIYETQLLFGTNVVYLTSTTANAWDVLGSGQPLSSTNPSATVSALAFAPTQTGVFYVGMSDGEVFVTRTTGADNFPAADSGLPINEGAEVTSITVDPLEASTAFVTYAAANGVASHVFMTTNYGATWTNISSNLPSVAAYSLAVDTNANIDAPNGKLYVATQVGVYYSVNSGKSWAPLGAGLPNVPVEQLQYNSSLDVLVAATLGRGIFTIGTNALAAIGNQTINENSVSSPIPITINDPGITGDTYTVTVTSSNTTLVPDSSNNLYLAGSGANRTLTIEPTTNQFGTAVITVTVTQNSLSSNQTFLLTVYPSKLFINENSSATLNFAPDTIVSTQSSNTTLVPNASVVIGSGSEALTITPATNQTGSGVITVSVTDPSTESATQEVNYLVTAPATLPYSEPTTPTTSDFLGVGFNEDTGGFSVSGGAGLASSASDNIATLDGVSATDVSVQVNLTTLSSGQVVALLARYSGSGDNNYYEGGIAATSTGYSFFIYSKINGNYNLLFSSTVTSSTSITGTLVFQVVKSSLRLYFDNSLVGYANDTGITGAGSVGIRTNALVTFSGFAASALSPTPASLTFTDTFANPTTAPAPSQLTSYWVNQAGNFADTDTTSPLATSIGGYDVATVVGLSTNDVSVQGTVFSLPQGDYATLVADYSGPNDNNYYDAGVTNNGSSYTALIQLNLNGGSTTLASQTFTGTFSGTLDFQVEGSSLELYAVNGGSYTLLAYAGNSALSAGSVGLRAYGAGVSFSSFSATALTITQATLSSETPFTDTFSTVTTPANQLSAYWTNQAGNFATTATSITAATWAAGVATLTASNNYAVGQTVQVAGITGATGYNGTFTITAATATTFSYALATQPTGTPGFTNATASLLTATGLGVYDLATLNGVSVSTMLNGVSISDVAVQATVNSLGVGQYATLIADYTGPTDANYYDAGVTNNGSTYTAVIYLNLNGGTFQLASQTYSGTFSGALRLEVYGDSLKLYDVSGGTYTLLAYASNSSLSAGSVGIRAYGAGVSFSNFNATVLTVTPASVVADQSAVTSATWSGGVATLTANNNYTVGEGVVVAGITGATGYNGAFVITAATSTSFSYALATQPTGVPGFTTATASEAFVDNFTTTTTPAPNQLTPYWTNQAGNFAVNTGTSTATGVGGSNLATLTGVSIPNVSATATVSVPQTNQFAALISRYSGPGDQNYYEAGLVNTGSGGLVVLYKNLGTKFVLLDSASVSGTSGTLQFITFGTTLSVYFNGTLQFSVSDTSLTSGGVGIRAASGATVSGYSASVPVTSLPFSDTFNGTQLSPTSWVTQAGSFSVASNVATGSGGYDLATVIGVNASNVAVQATVNSLGVNQYVALVADYSGPGDMNYYNAGVTNLGGSYQAFIYANVNGAATPLFLQTYNGTFSGTLYLEVYGDSLKLYDDVSGTYTLIAYADSSALTSGTVGMRVIGSGASVSAFSANTLTVTPATLSAGTPYNDTFSTATTPAAGQLPPVWTNQAGNFSSGSGSAVAFGSYDLAALTGVSVSNVTVQATVNTLGVNQYAALVADYSGPGDANYYDAGVTNTGSGYQAFIYANVNGATSLLNLQSYTGTFSGALYFQVYNGSLELYDDVSGTFTLLAYAGNSALSSGSVGIRAIGTGVSLSNFNATVLTVTPATLTGNTPITAASWSGGVATLTATNSYSVGQSVVVAGITGATGYDGTFTITAATPTTFSYALATQPTGSAGFTGATASQPFTDAFSTATTPANQLTAVWTNQAGNFSSGSGSAIAVGGYDLAALNSVNISNVAVQATVTSLGVNQYATLIADYTGPSDTNYYDAGVTNTGSGYTAVIYLNLNGATFQLASQSYSGTFSGALRLAVYGDSLKLYDVVSGTYTLLADATNGTLTGGSVGIRAIGAGVTFTNFSANGLTVTPVTVTGSVAITGASWSGGVATLVATNSYSVGQSVVVAGITGATGYDGTFTITAATPTTFSYALATQPTGSAGFTGATASQPFTDAFSTATAPAPNQLTGSWTNQSGNFSVGTGTAVSISGASWLAGVATITAANTFVVGQGVVVSGITGATGYNGTYIITAATATTFSYALATQPTGTAGFTSATASGYAATGVNGSNLATLTDFSAANISVQATVTVNSQYQFAGLVTRYSGPGDQNYYEAGLYNTGSGVVAVLYSNVNQQFTLLGSQSVSSTSGTLQFLTSGDVLSVTLNGTLLFSVVNSSLSGAGSVGIRATAGASVAAFSASISQ